MKPRKLYKGEIVVFLLSILGLYLVFALPLLKKDPVVFPDEVSFANTALSFFMGQYIIGF